MSAKANKYDLTNGGIFNKLLLVALPIMGTQIIQMAYNLTDMFWLGRLGADSVAASGTAGMYMWMSMAFMMIGRMGAEIGVSQNLGRGDKGAAQNFAQSAFSIAGAIGLGYALIMLLGRRQLVGFFNIQEAHVASDAVSYLAIVCLGMPFNFIAGTVTGVFNGSGNSRVPFVINCIGLGINIVLDPILIFTCNLGIAGAAWATVIAQVVTGVLSTLAILFIKNRPFEKFHIFARPKLPIAKQIFKWTMPISIESFLFTFLSMAVSRLIVQWGAGAMAAQRVGSQIESMSWLIGGGFSSAITAFMGQNFGAQKWDRIKQCFRISSYTMAVWGVIVTLVLMLFAEPIFKIFIPDDPSVVSAGVEYLRILAFCQVLACLEGAAAGAFRGVGKTIPPSVVSVISNVLRVVLAYVLSGTALGITGIWIAISAGAAIRGLWMYIWYVVQARKSPVLPQTVG